MTSRPNEGTAVSLWLPVSPESLLRKDGTAGSELPAHTSRRILLVDDDLRVLTVTADMLRELGHQPMEMASAHKALEVLRAGVRPDLAILDYAMPEMSGVALADAVREICPGLPVLLATGYSEREKAGGNLPRLDKPYTIAELARQIGLLIAK